MSKPRNDQTLPPQAIGVVLLLCILWGGLMVSVKVALEGVSPIMLAALRFTLGAFCIFLWTRAAGISLRPGKGNGAVLIGVGLVMTAQIITMNTGAHHTSASHAVVFMQSYPFFVALIAHYAVPGDRLNPAKVAGLILAGAGMVMTMGDSLGSGGGILGDALVLVSAVLLGAQTVIMKRLVARIVPETLLFWQMMVAVPIFTVVTVLTEWHIPVHFSTDILIAIAYQGIVIAGFCFVGWTMLLKRYSASRISAFFFTTPLFGVTLSWLILDDRITIHLIGGMVLLAVGLYVINRDRD